MTLPEQRTVAVLAVRDFLVRLLSPYVENGLKRIPKAVRQEARALLKHYPTPVDIYCAGTDSPDVFDDKEAIRWTKEWQNRAVETKSPSGASMSTPGAADR